jgi:hypothetical protein
VKSLLVLIWGLNQLHSDKLGLSPALLMTCTTSNPTPSIPNSGSWQRPKAAGCRPDPYDGSMDLGNPQSLNRYAYVANEPTNHIDPLGLFFAICA